MSSDTVTVCSEVGGFFLSRGFETPLSRIQLLKRTALLGANNLVRLVRTFFQRSFGLASGNSACLMERLPSIAYQDAQFNYSEILSAFMKQRT
jgi:hypothetical protein